MFQSEDKSDDGIQEIKFSNKRKSSNIKKYDEPEEFNCLNDLNTLPWTNAQEEFPEINFISTSQIENTNKLNKLEKEQMCHGEIYDEEEKIKTSFKPNINSNDIINFKKKRYLEKKRKRLSAIDKKIEINNNKDIRGDSENKKANNQISTILHNDFTKSKFHCFKITKINKFNPPFEELKLDYYQIKGNQNYETFKKVHNEKQKLFKTKKFYFLIKKKRYKIKRINENIISKSLE